MKCHIMYNAHFQVNPDETRRSSTYHSDVISNKTVKMSEVVLTMIIKWVKIFKNGPSKICGRQSLKNLKRYGLLRQTISLQTFLKVLFHKIFCSKMTIKLPKNSWTTLKNWRIKKMDLTHFKPIFSFNTNCKH